MFAGLKALLGRDKPIDRLKHLSFDAPEVVYAIGDVHGCLAQLLDLEEQIVRDGSAFGGDKLIVFLGDYIDRGPESAGVIDHLLSPAPDGFRRICLTGNHEQMALDFFTAPARDGFWLDVGGLETLQSYGISQTQVETATPHDLRGLVDSHIPREHIEFLKALPLTVTLPGLLFVHAGLRPGVRFSDQRTEDLLWIREDFLDAPGRGGLQVIHGHTPSPKPVIADGRICVDTGAYATGTLTTVRLSSTGNPTFLSATRNTL